MTTFWFIVLGVLFAVYFGLAGIDYGVGMLLPAHRGGRERRLALNAIGPMFLGNEVWIVGAAGVLIAAFPRLEAELFHATYPLLVAILLGLVAVNAGVQLRSRGRRPGGFDALITLASATLAVGWGMLLGSLLNDWPYTLLCGIVHALLVLAHGCAYLAWRRGDDRMRRIGVPTAFVAALGVVLAGASAGHVRNPLPAVVLGLLVAGAVAGAGVLLRRRRSGPAVLLTGLATALPVVVVGVALYPNVLVPVADAAAGDASLRLLAYAAAPLLPVLAAVQVACWLLFRRRPGVYW